MKILMGLKEWLGRRALRREVRSERKPVVKNLADAQKVGIVYLCRDEADHNYVRNYVKRIKEEHGISKVMALGYVDDKDIPTYLSARLNFDQFCPPSIVTYSPNSVPRYNRLGFTKSS